MTPLQQIIAFITAHNWLALAVFVIGYLVRLTSPNSKFPLSISPRFQPAIVVVLATLYAILQAHLMGSSWADALLHAGLAAAISMSLFDVVVKMIFNGKEPAWLQWLVLMVDQQAKTAEPTTSEAKKDPETPPQG